jgi:hypothetical protein
MRYEFHPEAEVDLIETILYYETQALEKVQNASTGAAFQAVCDDWPSPCIIPLDQFRASRDNPRCPAYSPV